MEKNLVKMTSGKRILNSWTKSSDAQIRCDPVRTHEITMKYQNAKKWHSFQNVFSAASNADGTQLSSVSFPTKVTKVPRFNS